jgi:hypothetical protein
MSKIKEEKAIGAWNFKKHHFGVVILEYARSRGAFKY